MMTLSEGEEASWEDEQRQLRRKAKALLVGTFFRQPAKFLAPFLANGTRLRLAAEPDNPYDSEAMAVWLPITPSMDFTTSYEELSEGLLSVGWTLEQLTDAREIQLGYLAREGNKQLAGLRRAGEALLSAAAAKPGEGRLHWGANGEMFVDLG